MKAKYFRLVYVYDNDELIGVGTQFRIKHQWYSDCLYYKKDSNISITIIDKINYYIFNDYQVTYTIYVDSEKDFWRCE